MAHERILIVEDDGILAAHLENTLTELGYEVLEPAATGEGAVDKVRTLEPDLVIMDIDLSGSVDGISATECIHSFSDVPVVYLTGYSQDPLLQDAKITAPYGYLVKPAPTREIAATIEMALYRHNLDTKLKESERKYRLLFHSHVAAFALHEIICDDEGVPRDYRFLEANPAFEAMTGLRSSEIVGRTVLEVLPDTESYWIEEYGKVALTGMPAHFEHYSGELDKYFEVTAYQTEPGKFATTFIDVTQRKSAEENLNRINERFSLATHAARMGVWDWDIQKDELVWDDRMYELYATKRSDFAGAYEAWLNGIHPDDREQCDRVSGEAVRGEREYDTEFRIMWHNGTVRVLKADATVIRDAAGNPLRMIGVNYDITEKKQAENELNRSRLQLSEAADMAKIACWEHDEGTGQFVFNDAFYELYGTTAEREGGYRMTKEEYGRRFVHPDDRERLMRQVKENRDKPRAGDVEQYEHRAIRADGEVIHILARNRVIMDREGRVLRAVGVNQDITARKKMEDALRESRARLDLALQSSEMGAWSWDILEDKRYFDDQVCKLLGLDPRTFAGTGQEFFDTVHPDDREAVRAALARSIENDTPYRSEYRAVWPDETIRYIAARGRLARDDKGRPVRVNGIIWDITERKKTETALRESEAKFRSYIEWAPLAVLVADHEGRIVDVNPAAARLLGFEKAALLERHVWELHPAEDVEEGLRKYAAFNRDGHIEGEFRFQRADGSFVWVSLHANMIGQGISLAYCLDISGQKKAEETLKRYELLSGHSRDVILFMTREGDILEANAAAIKAYGYSHEEMLRLTIKDLRAPNTVNLTSDQMAEADTHGILFESEHRRKDGSTFPVEVSARGASIGGKRTIISIVRDITERLGLQAQLTQAQKMEAIGTLAGGVAHDFNNILTVIMGLGNVIQMAVPEDDRIRPLADQIVLSSNRAAELTKSLLAFSRKQRIALEPHEVNSVIVSTAKLLKRLLTEDIALKVDLKADHAVAMLDVSQIDQVLMNLATNARDAMPNGGLLDIRTDTVQLDAMFKRNHGFGRPGPYVHISVTDTGVGMDERTMARIFDPFFTTKEVGKGTGLGLASVYGIVKQHGGYITVTSELLGGTTFDVYLPLVETAAQDTTVESHIVRGGQETILVIEDDPDVRNLIVNILAAQGYATIEAANGDDAIKVFEERKGTIKLLLLDVVMPGKNGRQVFDEIACIEPGIKAVFTSGYTGDIVIDKGIQKEDVEFLQKPLSMQGLLTKVREVLDR